MPEARTQTVGQARGGPTSTRQLVRWGLTSGASFVTNLGLTIILTELVRMRPAAAFAIAQLVMITTNFLAVRYFVFSISDAPVAGQLVKFLGLTGAFRSAEWVSFALLDLRAAADYRILVSGVLLTSSLIKFVVYKRVLRPPPAAGSTTVA